MRSMMLVFTAAVHLAVILPAAEGVAKPRRPLTAEEIKAKSFTDKHAVVEGVLHKVDDGVVFIAVPLAPKTDVASLLRRGALQPGQLKDAPKGTYLRYFTIVPGGPTAPMFKRRMGKRVALSIVRDTAGAWYVEDIATK
ncbi:MAG: hypothetical protein IPK13_05945 [Deltaproteobacteria bacterium]|nr:hypothetical protein [Deltaproteobacteria bacterium]